MGELVRLDPLDGPEFEAPTCSGCGTVVADLGELCVGCSAAGSDS